MEQHDLSRYTQMHQKDFERAFSEIKSGEKQSHWMWYIFPQIHSLGRSTMSVYYSIKSLEEAKAFLNDEYLGGNLISICNALLELDSNNATRIFGNPDDKKLKSCMTLFMHAADDNSVFELVLNKFFDGRQDNTTLRILGL